MIFKTPSIAVAGLLVALLGLAVSKPDTARVLRTRRTKLRQRRSFHAEFTLEAEGDSTNLTWAMQGPNP